MAINQNHLFEDLNGIKCAIVEKNVSVRRLAFLKKLLEFNRFSVISVASPPPKTNIAGTVSPAIDPGTTGDPILPPPDTFTVGVTDVGFNATNAIFGRLLKSPDGHVVTLAYWRQQQPVSTDDIPYFDINSPGS